MGNLGSRRTTGGYRPTGGGTAPNPGPRNGGGGSGGPEYADDGARSMPSYNSQAIADAIRRATAGIVGRSGRTATNLSGAGTRSYIGSLLGNVQ